jgi:hypothetical protein
MTITANLPTADRYVLDLAVPSLSAMGGAHDSINLDLNRDQAETLARHGRKFEVLHHAETIVYFQAQV